MPVNRHLTTWTGGQGLPGYTNLFFDDTSAADQTANVKNFWDTMKEVLPSSVTVAYSNTGEKFNSATGELLSEFTDATASGVWNGIGTSTYSAVSGACINWRTGSINRGRKVRGRTFIVPMASDKYELDGTLSVAARNVILSAANSLIAASAGSLVVWSRPRLGAGGQAAPVLSCTVRDVAAILTSRRD